MRRQQLWELLEDAAIALREASLAAAAAQGPEESIPAHARWIAADSAFKEVVDKLRAMRARRAKPA